MNKQISIAALVVVLTLAIPVSTEAEILQRQNVEGAQAAPMEGQGWDQDASGYIDDTEFYTFSYDSTDRNEDGLLNRDEWYDYSTAWFDPYNIDHGDFDYYDRDHSGFLDTEEYSYIIDDTQLYRYWGQGGNGGITSSQFDQGSTLSDQYLGGSRR